MTIIIWSLRKIEKNKIHKIMTKDIISSISKDRDIKVFNF